jgi:hypothetical protein
MSKMLFVSIVDGSKEILLDRIVSIRDRQPYHNNSKRFFVTVEYEIGGKVWEANVDEEELHALIKESQSQIVPAVPGTYHLSLWGDTVWQEPVVAWVCDGRLQEAVPVTPTGPIERGAVLFPDGKVAEGGGEGLWNSLEEWKAGQCKPDLKVG